jgi:hypothetical protein
VGIRMMAEERMVVSGGRDEWFGFCQRALTSQKFKKVSVNSTTGQVRGNFKQVIGTLRGDIVITLTPEGPNTLLTVRATANVENVSALVARPGAELIKRFKVGLDSLETPRAAAQEVRSVPITDLPHRFAAMRGADSPTDAQSQSSTSQLLARRGAPGLAQSPSASIGFECIRGTPTPKNCLTCWKPATACLIWEIDR